MLVLAIIMLLMHPLLFCIKIIKKKKKKNQLIKQPGLVGPPFLKMTLFFLRLHRQSLAESQELVNEWVWFE